MTLLTDIFGNNNVVRSTIENGDTTHAPSGDTIFHALEGKVSTSLTINGLPLTSNCKYFNNPGFVCPLSAYREPSMFQING
jgi:hypothetical protein